IASGKTMLAAMVLGAEGVQIGSRFVASNEASSHQAFKDRVVEAGEGETLLTLKELAPVRLIKNKFYEEVRQAYANCASPEDLKELLGRARAKRGMFEGDLEQGELEIGQVSAQINEIKPAAEIVQEIVLEFETLKKALSESLY
ncbi:nitronate monooxygenase, partial [uncultured Eudoraea sp.]|uniref:NAD(P)H-dependent flavin oxidoreductase n=1 Tax=uncultured Eudoraea sp. TaxID=1035614 RepID=UPI0026379CBB